MIHQPTPAAPSLAVTLGILLAALVACGALLPYFTTDVGNDYIPWFNHIVATGPIAAFAEPFSAYTPPYLYILAALVPLKGLIPDYAIVKLAAALGTAALGGALWHLLRRLDVPQSGRIALCALALPSILLNAALLGQCDAMYAAPCVMALAAALDRRHVAMFAWCGIAIAFKAQAVLFAPFVLALVIGRRVPFHLWLAAPAAFLAAMLPAWLAGWPAEHLLTIYFRQAGTFADVARNAPNIWMILDRFGIDTAALIGLAGAIAIGVTAAYVAWGSILARRPDPIMLVRLALLAPLLTAGLLPKMHDRYFFVADVLALALFAARQDRDTLRIAILVQAGSTCALFAYVSGLTAFAAFGGIAMIAATWLTARPFLRRAANDNPMLARGV